MPNVGAASPIRALSFDCYGTLVDWQRGILAALRPALASTGRITTDEQIIRAFADAERRAEAPPYRPYKRVLEDVAAAILGDVPQGDHSLLWCSIPDWLPFPDTRPSLLRLRRRFTLAVASNIDDDLFAATHARLGVPLDAVVTAEQIRSYKPATAHFETLLRALGLRPDQLLHVGESRYHDIEPANRLGIPCAWVNRTGAAASASGPGAGAPDLTVRSLAELAARLDPAR